VDECKPLPAARWAAAAAEGWAPAAAEGWGQGRTLVLVRAQLEQLQDTFTVKLGYTVDRRAQVELTSERV
jgi:hypothetical protein